MTKYFNYKPYGVFSSENLVRIKDGAHAINLMTNKDKEHLGFHYLLRIQNFDLCGFYCSTFMGYIIAGKNLFDYAKLFSRNGY